MVPALRPEMIEESVTTTKDARLDVLEQAFGVAVEGRATAPEDEDEVAALRARVGVVIRPQSRLPLFLLRLAA